MKWISIYLVVIYPILSGSISEGVSTCKNIKTTYPNSASGVYEVLWEKPVKKIEVYCEMGLDNGGYTFINSRDLQLLTNADIQEMFTNKTSFLLRIRKCNNAQPYIVLRQLAQYKNIPLKLGLNDYSGYQAPVNVNILGSPYLYFGFIPVAQAASRTIQGVWANGREYTFLNGDSNANSHFSLFANYKETQPTTYSFSTEWILLNQVLDSAQINPSKREMPVEYFYFGETHFGGGGWYSQTDARLDKKCISSFAIGFR